MSNCTTRYKDGSIRSTGEFLGLEMSEKTRTMFVFRLATTDIGKVIAGQGWGETSIAARRLYDYCSLRMMNVYRYALSGSDVCREQFEQETAEGITLWLAHSEEALSLCGLLAEAEYARIVKRRESEGREN